MATLKQWLVVSSVAASTLLASGRPAEAFTFSTSAAWDNVDLTTGVTVGSEGEDPDQENTVEFVEADGASQVRWGNPASGGEKVYVKTGKNKGYWKEVFDYQDKSGLGFKGVQDLSVEAGNIFNLGSLIHYNKPIYDPAATQVDFSLALNFADLGLDEQLFNFSLNIDETPNNQKNCPYTTTGSGGCSDRITWEQSITSENTFNFEGEDYTLELVGFGNVNNSQVTFDSFQIQQDFISQEGGESKANLYGRLTKIAKGDHASEEIPEPAALLGLGLLGAYLVKSRRSSDQTA